MAERRYLRFELICEACCNFSKPNVGLLGADEGEVNSIEISFLSKPLALSPDLSVKTGERL